MTNPIQIIVPLEPIAERLAALETQVSELTAAIRALSDKTTPVSAVVAEVRSAVQAAAAQPEPEQATETKRGRGRPSKLQAVPAPEPAPEPVPEAEEEVTEDPDLAAAAEEVEDFEAAAPEPEPEPEVDIDLLRAETIAVLKKFKDPTQPPRLLMQVGASRVSTATPQQLKELMALANAALK